MSEETDNSFESEDSSMLEEEEEVEELEEEEANKLNIMYYVTNDEGSSCGYCHGKKCSFSYGIVIIILFIILLL